MRGVTYSVIPAHLPPHISTHTPHARRDKQYGNAAEIYDISTHTPHARRDGQNPAVFRYTGEFLLTRLMRGVTLEDFDELPEIKISTHTPHARRDLFRCQLAQLHQISTHTPHARRD